MEQEKRSRVKVEALLSVVSGKPTDARKIHELSRRDQAMAGHTIHLVLYYPVNPFRHGPLKTGLDNLRVSLSRLLDEYPVVTGRLERGPEGAWRVKCNDAGVRIVGATVSATLDEWLGSTDPWEERDLTVWDDMPVDPSFWSPFRIQINNFKCGAVAIGLSCSHMNADITSAATLIKSWAEVHSGQPLTHPPIFHLRQSPPSSPRPTSPKTTDHTQPHNKLITATLKFPAASIESLLLQEVRSHCPAATPFDALVALFWSRLARLQEPKPRKSSLRLCLDSREKGLVPHGYFGNGFISSVVNVDEDRFKELGRLADCVHCHVVDLNGDGDLCVGPMYGPHLTCMDVSRGGRFMYGSEFEEGEGPVEVSCWVGGGLGGEGLIMVMPVAAKGGDGLAVRVVLPEGKMERLWEEGEIKGLGATVVLGGREIGGLRF